MRLAAVVGAGRHAAGDGLAARRQDKKQTARGLHGDVARLLRNSPYPDLRNKALIAFPPPGKIDPKKLPSIAVLASGKGDAVKGKKLLAASIKSDMQCLKCHTIRGIGGQIGPDLSMIGKKASRENLFESILCPARPSPTSTSHWKIETKTGIAVTGLIVEETPDHVVSCATPTARTRRSTKRTSIRGRKARSR